MLFLLPIPISLVVAMAWASWSRRPPRPADPATTVQEWQRAVRVLAPAELDRAPLPKRDRELVSL